MRVSISVTTASVFSSVEPEGIVTVSLKLGLSISSVVLILKARLIRRAAKNATRLPMIVTTGFLMLAFRTRL